MSNFETSIESRIKNLIEQRLGEETIDISEIFEQLISEYSGDDQLLTLLGREYLKREISNCLNRY